MSTSPPDVAITGIGIVSPLGHDLATLAHRYLAGERVASTGDAAFVEDVPLQHVPEEKRSRIGRADRLCRFFLSASYAAIQSSGLDLAQYDAQRCGLSFGTALGCLLTNEEYNRKIVEHGLSAASPRLFAYTVSSAAAGEVSIALGIKGPNLTSHMGWAAGLGAVGYAYDLIRMGKADMVLAGGGDVLGAPLVEALRDMGLLKKQEQSRPFVDEIPGIFPSEASVMFVLERGDLARQRGARSFGRLIGYAAGFEPTLTRSNRSANALTATLRRMLAGHDPNQVAAAFCSAHGTALDRLECQAIRESCGPAALLLAPKAAIGEAFAGSGLLALALALGIPPVLATCDIADTLGFDSQGKPIDGGRLRKAISTPALMMVDALCYSGNLVSLLLAGEKLN